MKQKHISFIIAILMAPVLANESHAGEPRSRRWTPEQATQWQAKQPWYVGCNFIPSNAVNQLEMWQADTFDPATLDRELGWAQSIGMNCARVFLHDLAYQQDPEGFLKRIDQYLTISNKHQIKTLLVFFDDCHQPEAQIGKQPAPRPSVHNSRWLRSPGIIAGLAVAKGDKSTTARLEKYMKDVITRFADDSRIMGWDLYNEPLNEPASSQLLQLAFAWAQELRPSQPLTSGVFQEFIRPEIEATQLAQSDVMTFHTYLTPQRNRVYMDKLASRSDRPLFLCSEFMARPIGSTVQGCLPEFKARNVGAMCWGLVRGKTNTIWGWDTMIVGNAPAKAKAPAPEPKLWFHDVLNPDGTPHRPEEIQFIKQLKATPK